MKRNRGKLILWACIGGFALVCIAGFIWLKFFQRSLPPGVWKDIQAGLPARDIRDPDKRLAKYLEGRYGALSDPSVRDQVFLDFFEADRIKALQFLVQHSPPESRQANIDAMARWVAGYRESLTPQQRAQLGAVFGTPEGQAKLRRATAQYNAQDVRYRGNTAPVISQLLKTLHEAEQASQR